VYLGVLWWGWGKERRVSGEVSLRTCLLSLLLSYLFKYKNVVMLF